LPYQLPTLVFEQRVASVLTRGEFFQVTMDWAKYLGKKLVDASWQGIEALKDVLPAETAVKLLEAACVLLRHEATVVDVSPVCSFQQALCLHNV